MSHAHEATEVVETHDSGHNRNVDVVFLASLLERGANIGLKDPSVCDNGVPACVDVLIQVGPFLCEGRIAAHRDGLFPGLVLDDACPSLLILRQLRHTAFDFRDVVRVAFWVVCDGPREVVAVFRGDVLLEVQCTVKSAVDDFPLILPSARVTAEGDNVARATLLFYCGIDLGGLHVGTRDVLTRDPAELFLISICESP